MDDGKRRKRVTKRNEESKNLITDNLSKNTTGEHVKSEGKRVNDIDKYIERKIETILKEKSRTAGTKFKLFEEYSKCELRTKRLEYILEIEKHANVPENKLSDNKH